MGPVLKLVARGRRGAEAVYEEWCPDCDPGDSRFRVTDRRRRWTKARHFMDAGTALRHAGATGGVVWERYVGPTGAVNWWSLTDAECEAMATAEWQPDNPGEAASASAAVRA